jgi:hypothetical protein
MFAANDPNPVVLLIPVLVMAIIVLAVLGILRLNHSRRMLALIAAAARWDGRVFNPGMFGQPHAELRIGSGIARVQFSNANKQGFTEFTIHFPDPVIRLEIYPQTIIHQMRKLLGMQDIEVGVRSFDDLFIIQGNNPTLIREYLALPAQQALRGLADFTALRNLHCIIGGSTMRVTKNKHLSSERELLLFLAGCETLYIALLEARTLGIEYLPNLPPSLRPESHCQVCGEGLSGKIVYCTGCHTPHHLDCWQYIGHCSVYACGQKRYRAAS